MTRTLPALAAALLLTGATALQAQTPPADAGKGPRHGARDCSQAKDPKLCEERRQKIRAARDEARKACEGRQGPERRECLTKSMCAKAPDPARCEARAKGRADERAEKMRRKMQREHGDPNPPRGHPEPDAKKS